MLAGPLIIVLQAEYIPANLEMINLVALDFIQRKYLVSYTCHANPCAFILNISVANAIAVSTQRQTARSSLNPTSLKITGLTRNFPPFNLTWYRNTIPIDASLSNINLTTTITDRLNAYYDNTLLIRGNPDDLIGSYVLSIGNGSINHTLIPPITGK